MTDVLASFYSSEDDTTLLTWVDIDVANVRFSKLTVDHLGIVKGLGKYQYYKNRFLNFERESRRNRLSPFEFNKNVL